MKQNDIDWKSGKVIYWDLESVDPEKPTVDPEKPTKDQLLVLKEDLAQVNYPGNLLLDRFQVILIVSGLLFSPMAALLSARIRPVFRALRALPSTKISAPDSINST